MAEKRKTDQHWVMVIDQDRCVGCWTCAVACKGDHNGPDGVWWIRVLTTAPNQAPTHGEGVAAHIDEPQGTYPELQMAYRPMHCLHCEDAPCVSGCPVGATFRREDGVVLVDYDRCIGCRVCVAECPVGSMVFTWGDGRYPTGAPSGWPFDYATDGRTVYTPERASGLAEKCTLCVERIDQDLPPCCVEICPVGARTFGDANDPNSEVRRMIDKGGAIPALTETGVRPRVYYRPARKRDIATPSERLVAKHATMQRTPTS